MVQEDPCVSLKVLNAVTSIRAGVPHFSYEDYFYSPFPPAGTWGGIECTEDGNWKFVSDAPEFADTKNMPTSKDAREKWHEEVAAKILADLGDRPDADATRDAAVILWRADNPLAAVDLIGKIPEKTPHDRFWEAYILGCADNRQKESISKFKDILIDDPSAIAYHNLADACAGPGDSFCYLDEKGMSAVVALRKKAAAFPSCPPYAYAAYVVSVAVSTNRADDVAPLVQDARERAPQHADALRRMLIARLILEGRDEDALRETQAAFPDLNSLSMSTTISSMCIHARSNQVHKTKEHATHAAKLLDDYRRKQQEQETFGKNHDSMNMWVSARVKIGDVLASIRLEKEAVAHYDAVASIPAGRWACSGRIAKASMFLARGAIQKAALEIAGEIEKLSMDPYEIYTYDLHADAAVVLNVITSVVSTKARIRGKVRGTALLAAYQILSEISAEELLECWPGTAEKLQAVSDDHHRLLLEATKFIDVPNVLLAVTHWYADEDPLFVRHFLLHLIEKSTSIKTADDIDTEATKHFHYEDGKLKFFEWLGGFGKDNNGDPGKARAIHDAIMSVLSGAPKEGKSIFFHLLEKWREVLSSHQMFQEYIDAVDQQILLWGRTPWNLTVKCWVLNEMNRIEDAVAAGEAALKEDTEQTSLNTRSEARFHLARAYISAGNPEKAADLAQWAYTNNPKSKKYKDFDAQVKSLIVEKQEKEKEAAKHEQFIKTARQRYFGLDTYKKRLLAILNQIDGYESHEDLARLSGVDAKSIPAHFDALQDGGFLEFNKKGSYTVNPHIADLLGQQHVQVGATVAANPAERSNRPIFNSDGEKTLYRILTVTLPNFLVMPNVSLQAIFGYETMKSKRDDGALTTREFSYFLNSYADFCVVSTMTYIPVVCFELDSKSHDGPDRKQKDTMKDRLFEAGGIPLVRVRFYDHMDEQQARTEVIKAMQGAGILSGISV